MKGLQNIGNTCYMNSALQLLLNCSDFKNIIINYPVNNKLQYIPIIKTFITDYEISNKNVINPVDIKELIEKYNKQFMGNKQQDAYEFLIYFLDMINSELSKDFNLFNIFGLEFNINFKCKMINCLNENEHIEKELFLNLDMDNNLNNSYRKYKSIVKLIDDNLYYCEKCKQKQPGRKRTENKRWANNLIIVLKRFNYNLQKDNSNIDIPLNWRHNYKLKGGILHSGGVNGGHYIYYGLVNDKWYIFDDSTIRELNNIDDYLKKSYILHYQK
jgi:ubiquitin carboxyl-terminal hydrolase 36/42